MKNTNTTTQSTEAETGNEPASVPPEIDQPDPEVEWLRTENESLRNSIRERDARDQIEQLLTAADAHSTGLLFKAVKDDLQFDDDGKLQNAAALVERLKRRYPEQFGPTRRAPVSIDGGAGSSNPSQLLSAESLARMTPAQIQKLDWAEVRRVLSEK